MVARFMHYTLPCAAALSLAACFPSEQGAQEAPAASSSAGAETADEALAAFGLAEQGRVSWETRTRDGAVYTYETVTISDPEGGLVADRLVIADPALGDDGPVFSRFELTGAEATEAEGDFVAMFDRLVIAQAGPEVAEAVAAALQGREPLFDGADPAAGRFGEMRIEGLTVTGTSETGAPLDISLASAGATGHDGETLETVQIDELRLVTADETGAPLTLTLGAVSAQGVASQLAGLAEGGAAGAPLAGALTPNSQYQRFSMRDLDVRASGVHVVMPGLSGSVEEAGGGRLVSRTVMEQLSVRADAEAGAPGARFADSLDQLGYEALNFSLENTVVYDVEADRVQTIEDNFLRLEDGFTLRFEQTARGAQAYAERYADWLAEGGEAGQTPPATVFEPLMIERMVVALEDESLLDRSLGVLAQMQGVTPEQLRVQAGAYVALGAAFAGEMVPPRLLSELQGALTGFIGQGGTLTVTMAPADPVSVSVLMQDGAGDSERLGLSVTHEAP